MSNLIIILILFFSSSFAQMGDDYKIISHYAFIKLYPTESKVIIVDTIQIKIKSSHKGELNFKLNPLMRIEDVIYKNSKIKFERSAENLKIFSISQDAELVIKYSGIINYKSEFSQMSVDGILLYEQEIFPIGTKSYEEFQFTIQAPPQWNIITAGKPILQYPHNDSTIYVFKNDKFVQTIGWICGGKYYKTSNEVNGLKISTYLFPNDSSYSQLLIEQSFKIIDYYNEQFGKYRFNKLDIVEVEDWVAGKAVLAAAFPSVILVKKQAFQTEDKFNSVSTILPHEMAHQWFPLSVFVEENDVALLSEGLCEYSSILFGEWSGDPQARDSLKNHPLKRMLLMRASKGKDLPLHRKADLRSMPTHYLKGAYVHNMLRFIIGDSVFRILLKEFTNQKVVEVTNTSDYKEIAEKLSGKKLDWFFKQWTEETGIPRLKVYGVKTNQLDGKWITQGRVRLLGYEKKYTTLVEITVETETEEKNNIYWIGFDEENNYRNEISFTIGTKDKPLKVILDKNENILKYQKLPAKLSDLRDPSDGIMILGTQAGEERYNQLYQIAKRDSAEMDKAGWWLKFIPDTAATLVNLQDDRVFIYGNIIDNKIAEEVASKFVFIPQTDKIQIDDVTYSDSLGFIQIIDNPYRDDGLICWIIPFTENSYPHLLPYDASYVVVNKSEIIKKGNWVVRDEDLVVEVK